MCYAGLGELLVDVFIHYQFIFYTSETNPFSMLIEMNKWWNAYMQRLQKK